MAGDRGIIELTAENSPSLMPTIVHLRTLSTSMENVIITQATDVRVLLRDYVGAMEEMVGKKPNLQFLDEQ